MNWNAAVMILILIPICEERKKGYGSLLLSSSRLETDDDLVEGKQKTKVGDTCLHKASALAMRVARHTLPAALRRHQNQRKGTKWEKFG